MAEYIYCSNCNKLIQQRWRRTLCIACSNKRDKEIAKIYRETHQEEIRAKCRERARRKRAMLKWEE